MLFVFNESSAMESHGKHMGIAVTVSFNFNLRDLASAVLFSFCSESVRVCAWLRLCLFVYQNCVSVHKFQFEYCHLVHLMGLFTSRRAKPSVSASSAVVRVCDVCIHLCVSIQSYYVSIGCAFNGVHSDSACKHVQTQNNMLGANKREAYIG